MSLLNYENNGSINAWVPRSLIIDGKKVLGLSCNRDGLCPIQIKWVNGKTISIEGINNSVELPLSLLIPRFVEPHAHLDKAFTWNDYPNFKGSYEMALEVNLKEQLTRTEENVRFRAQKALKLALRNGIRAIRTHIDSVGLASDESWEVLGDLKSQWKSLVELQLVALVPLDYWCTEKGKLLATRVVKKDGLLGGVLAPPFDKKKSEESLRKLIQTANQLGCDIDLHIDESQISPGAGLKLLLKVLEEVTSNISITCSHLSSMSLLSRRELIGLADRLAELKIKVVALPLTNAWLLGRDGRGTSVNRPLAPIFYLQKSGVIVGVGGDNVKDPWFPLGGFDPLELMAFSMPLTQLAPWQRLGLAPFTTASADIMDLDWDGTFYEGSPANWIVIEATSWADALSLNPKRKVIVNGYWLNENMIPTG